MQCSFKQVDWSLPTKNDDVNLQFETFQYFARTFGKHVPYKEIRKKNEIETSKPWITKGIKNQ